MSDFGVKDVGPYFGGVEVSVFILRMCRDKKKNLSYRTFDAEGKTIVRLFKQDERQTRGSRQNQSSYTQLSLLKLQDTREDPTALATTRKNKRE